jgi:hypothetical protein
MNKIIEGILIENINGSILKTPHLVGLAICPGGSV